MRNEPESSTDAGGVRFYKTVLDCCQVAPAGSVFVLFLYERVFVRAKAEGSVIHRATSGEQAGCSLSRQTM